MGLNTLNMDFGWCEAFSGISVLLNSETDLIELSEKFKIHNRDYNKNC